MFNKIVKLSVLLMFVIMSTLLIAQTNGTQVATTDEDHAINWNNGSGIARTSDGTLMAVYGTSQDSMVYSKTYDSGFGTWNAAVGIDKGMIDGGDIECNARVVGFDNNFHVVYLKNDKIYYSQGGGSSWSTPVQVPNTSAPWDTVQCNKTTIDIDSDGNIVIAWGTDLMDDGDEHFFISKSTDNGSTWGEPDTLFASVTPGIIPSGYCMPAIATGPDGIIGVTAREKDESLSTNYQMYFQEYNGTSWEASMLLTTLHDSADIYQANLDYDENGTCHCVFYTDEDDWPSWDADIAAGNIPKGQILYTQKTSGSTDWSEPVAISQDLYGKADYPAIAAGDNGSLYAVYLGYGNDNLGEDGYLRVFYTTSDDGGDTWTTASILDSTIEDMPLRGPSICKSVPSTGADILYISSDSTETDGYSIYYGNIPYVDYSAVENNEIPEDYSLLNNYPNPFNPFTTIEFEVNTNDLVKLTVYNVLGEKIASLVNEEMKIGSYKVQFNSQGLSSGIFFVRLVNGENAATKKMVLIK